MTGDGRVPGLTRRESEVARAVSEGLPNRRIAERLGISERTVKRHLGSAFRKLGIKRRLALAVVVLSQGPE